MGRPNKQGIDYFPVDVDFFSDRKIRKIMRNCGMGGVSTLICLLGNIYKENGYYIEWDEELSFDISDQLVGISESLVREVISKAIQVGFFNKDLFDRYKILTSNGIQKRFKEATRRRENLIIEGIYWISKGKEGEIVIDNKNEVSLNDISINGTFVNNNSSFVYRSTQSKGK